MLIHPEHCLPCQKHVLHTIRDLFLVLSEVFFHVLDNEACVRNGGVAGGQSPAQGVAAYCDSNSRVGGFPP